MECKFEAHLKHPYGNLCMLYCNFTIDGRHWANYPDCKKENCPLLHPELLGNLIWENKNAPVV